MVSRYEEQSADAVREGKALAIKALSSCSHYMLERCGYHIEAEQQRNACWQPCLEKKLEVLEYEDLSKMERRKL